MSTAFDHRQAPGSRSDSGPSVRLRVLATAAFLVLVTAAAAGAQTPEPKVGAPGIAGTRHDFSQAGWNVSGRLCVVCHTPHGANSQVAGPLWNRAASGVTEYTVYSSATLNAEVGQPDGVSKTCLSCHDGTVALENFGGAEGGGTYVGGQWNVGTDLSGNHPVSFDYDGALAAADGDLYDPGARPSGLGGTVSSDLLFEDRVQCASCHDPHDNTHGDFLIKSNLGSELCLTCHAM